MSNQDCTMLNDISKKRFCEGECTPALLFQKSAGNREGLRILSAYDIPKRLHDVDDGISKTFKTIFGTEEATQREVSPVHHIAKDKHIPPFLILHVSDHPDNSAQAQRLGAVLKEAGIPVTVFGGKETNHTKINANLGTEGDPATKALTEFVAKILKP